MKENLIIVLIVVLILLVCFMFYRMEKKLIKGNDAKMQAILALTQNSQGNNFVDTFNQLT